MNRPVWQCAFPERLLGEFRQLRAGGNFESSDKDLPPIVVVQLGGPDVSGGIVIDEVELSAGQ